MPSGGRAMDGELLGHVPFTDGARRPVYGEADRQYTCDNDGEKVYGLFLIPWEECSDLPVIVQGATGGSAPQAVGRGQGL